MKINEIDKLEVNSTIDVIAVVRSATEVSEIISQKLQGISIYDGYYHDIECSIKYNSSLLYICQL